ncbi:MAG: hypothetical protein K9L56_14770 [Clostridiales bacterium]|nr:hypothetical protein [Clostridiales bacterium]
MIFKELINSVNYEEVWHVLDRDYELESGAYEVYRHVFEELQSFEPSLSESVVTTLVVAKVEDPLEPGKIIFDVFGIEKGDESHYALEMVSWDEWLNFHVLKKSIETYGAADVVAYALYDMTFFGFSAEAVAKKVAEEKQILNERHEEVERGNVQFVSLEEVMADLGIIDNRTPEEEERQLKETARIIAENKKVYKDLLGRGD